MPIRSLCRRSRTARRVIAVATAFIGMFVAAGLVSSSEAYAVAVSSGDASKPALEDKHGMSTSGENARPSGKKPSAADTKLEPANPSEVISANDLKKIVDIARGYGDAEITHTEGGDPVILGDLNGVAYQLFFLDCTQHRNCTTLNFYAIWNVEDVSLDAINEWNRTQPFHKSYLSDGNLPVVELNISAAGGITRGQLVDVYNRWTVALAEFQQTVLG